MISNISLVNLFEKQVLLNKNRIAICSGEQKLTYQALNDRSNQVARYLIENNVKAGDIVGLLFDRSPDFLVAMWGVLKAGATYLPLEPELPLKRITFMLSKSKAATILTHREYAKQYSKDYAVYTLERSEIKSQSTENLGLLTNSADPAYCIFTSGSSGYPKGVLMGQSSVINLVHGLEQIVYNSYQDTGLKVALVASFSFDASVQQIYAALLMGHTLHIVDDESRKDGEALLHFFNNHQIDISDGTPTHLRLMVKSCPSGATLNTLSNWLIAGEVLSKNLVNSFYEKLGERTQLFNLYGPTETCVDSTYFKVSPDHLDDYESIPIGKPFPNERAYVADQEGKPLSPGDVGELCIAGAGLAKTYINDQTLTNEKFSQNWIDGEPRVYRTGDMVKILPDGNLQYQGRIDNQIKLRGLRIELSEIEFQMCTHELIDHTVVEVKEIFQEEQLVLYYEAAQEVDSSVLRTYLTDRLPNYMVPSHFVQMEQLPLNVSGKIDRYALPDVEVLAESNSQNLTAIDKKLIKIWEEVLEVPPNWVGLETNFFKLGGNSLKAVLITNRIKQEFEVDISFAQFFEFQTISNFSDHITNTTAKQHLRILPSKDPEQNPMTVAQKSFYFLNSLYNKQSVTYNIPLIFELSGQVCLEKLNASLRKLTQRYEVLRTSFHENEAEIHCALTEESNITVESLAFKGEIESSILNFLKPFDLSQGPLFRVGLLEMDANQQFLVFDIHHIISDEASNRILIEELISLYNGEDLPKPVLQYRDYAVWQHGEAYQKLVSEHKDYWLDIYSREVPALELPTDHPRPLTLSNEAHTYTIKLDKGLSSRIREVMAQESTTVFNFLFAVYYILLNKLSNQEDIVIGIPVSGRHHLDLEKIVGLFVNTLALRNYPKGQLSVKKFLAELQENTLQALDHQLYPYIELVDALRIPRDLNQNPLFEVCFNYNQKIEELVFGNSALKLQAYDMRPSIAKFDLTLDVLDSAEEIELSFIGRSQLFNLSTIERFAGYFRNIVEQVISNVDQPIENIDILPEAEREKLLSYNPINEVPEMSVLEVFAKQVQNTPDNKAVAFNDQALTYRELDQQSDRLANYLVSKGIDQEEFIGILLDRSVEMIVSILAVLKMGSAYVPLDPEFPDHRIAFQLEDAGIKWVLTASKYGPDLQEKGCKVIALDEEWEKVLSTSDKPLQRVLKPEDKMYIIYTSGSTGRPKGVVTEHRGLVNMALDLVDRFDITPEDRVFQLARITFDASILEILMAILSGAALVLVEKETIIDGESIIEYMEKQEVSLVFFTPAYLKVLDKEKLKFLRCIISIGEAANVEDMQYLSQYVECHNGYGPTECSAIATTYSVDPTKNYNRQIPIGTPVCNTRIYILDGNDNFCPTGVIGELCIAGIGVSKGYLNRPELNEERFVTDPFDRSQRMYRTGDYARWNEDGQVEYFGRRDNQVKIRGFRIELGEIEALLDESGFVKQASVQIIEDEQANKQIVAFVVPDGDTDPGIIQDYLGGKLPSYMNPSYIVNLDHIPLTLNGKVDRSMLIQNQAAKPNIVRPVNSVEQKLLEIWSEELGIRADIIGTNDNFFNLGGNSLNAMKIIIKINTGFNTEITISEVFRFQTIKQLAKQIEINQWLDQSEPVQPEEKRREALI